MLVHEGVDFGDATNVGPLEDPGPMCFLQGQQFIQSNVFGKPDPLPASVKGFEKEAVFTATKPQGFIKPKAILNRTDADQHISGYSGVEVAGIFGEMSMNANVLQKPGGTVRSFCLDRAKDHIRPGCFCLMHKFGQPVRIDQFIVIHHGQELCSALHGALKNAVAGEGDTVAGFVQVLNYLEWEAGCGGCQYRVRGCRASVVNQDKPGCTSLGEVQLSEGLQGQRKQVGSVAGANTYYEGSFHGSSYDHVLFHGVAKVPFRREYPSNNREIP